MDELQKELLAILGERGFGVMLTTDASIKGTGRMLLVTPPNGQQFLVCFPDNDSWCVYNGTFTSPPGVA